MKENFHKAKAAAEKAKAAVEIAAILASGAGGPVPEQVKEETQASSSYSQTVSPREDVLLKKQKELSAEQNQIINEEQLNWLDEKVAEPFKYRFEEEQERRKKEMEELAEEGSKTKITMEPPKPPKTEQEELDEAIRRTAYVPPQYRNPPTLELEYSKANKETENTSVEVGNTENSELGGVQNQVNSGVTTENQSSQNEGNSDSGESEGGSEGGESEGGSEGGEGEGGSEGGEGEGGSSRG
jgi:hypothetical protein